MCKNVGKNVLMRAYNQIRFLWVSNVYFWHYLSLFVS